MGQDQRGPLGLRVSSLSEPNLSTTPDSSSSSSSSTPSDKWINFEVAYDDDDGEMMQNDAPAPPAPLAVVPITTNRTAESIPGATRGEDFRQVMHQLEELKEKPLFSEDELEEATEEDDLFDDEDYDLEEFIRLHRQKLEESRRKAGFVDDEDDDYDDYYSAEEDEEEQKRARAKQAKDSLTGRPNVGPVPAEGDTDSVMQDYLTNIKSKSAPHRFKSKFDDFDDGVGADGELLSGGSNRKLRKNDSIKIISTPNGKVGIVYKVEPKATDDETAKGAHGEAGGSGSAAAAGEHQRQNKITPVITADGKVALLYRGASDNGDSFRNKYEPITAKDLRQLIDNNNNSNGSSTATAAGESGAVTGGGTVGSNTNSSIKNITNNNIYNSHNKYDNSYDSFNRNINNNVIVDSNRQSETGDDSRENSAAQGAAGGAPTVAYPWPSTTPMPRGVVRTTTPPPVGVPSSAATNQFFGAVEDPARGPFDPEAGGLNVPDRQENSLLINRPLSEVLGIRKNQYSETNTIKIPNIETSTHKMRITNNNNLLSSLLHSRYHGTAANGTDDHGHHNHPHGRLAAGHRNAEEEHRRAGYSVNGFSRSRFYINRRTTPALPPRVIKEEESEEDTVVTGGSDNMLPEVVNLAIIPAFEHEIDEKYIRPSHGGGGGGGDFHRRHRHQYNVAPGQPAVHCAMQALVACAVMATFFGIVGTYFKSRVVDHIRVLYW